MREHHLRKLLNDAAFLDGRIEEFRRRNAVAAAGRDEAEIEGHIEKAKHNLNFVRDILKMNYPDWCITGCYYAVYHAALALVLAKGYSSRDHEATLCLLIREYYRKGIGLQEIEILGDFFITYHDVLTYVESKDKREKATYSTERHFDQQAISNLRLKAILFVDKAKKILGKQ